MAATRDRNPCNPLEACLGQGLVACRIGELTQ